MAMLLFVDRLKDCCALLLAIMVAVSAANEDNRGLRSDKVSEKERIVGGQDVTPYQYPYMVSIQYTRKTQNALGKRREHWCGGTILNEWSILTAAHCCRTFKTGTTHVIAGEHNLTKSHSHEQEVEVETIVMHPEYNRSIGPPPSDICVLTLKRELNFNTWVQPVRLPQTMEIGYSFGYNSAIILGWGHEQFGGSQSDVLKSVQVPIISDTECQLRYSNTKWEPNVLDSHVCTGHPANSNSTVTDGGCRADSGGPMMCGQPPNDFECGITSWGIGCGYLKYPGIYVEVAYYLDFIRNSMKKSAV